MAKGMAFWRQDEDSSRRHLRFVISEPNTDDQVLLVHMTTWRNTGREDPSCVLESGEHPCIKTKSYIRYDMANEVDYSQLLAERFRGDITVQEDASSTLLAKIQAGARKSPALRRVLKKKYVSLF